MAKPPKVSIAIVNWNGLKFLSGCLGSVYAQGYPSVEVLFVDNGSTDGSVEFVRDNFPETILIRNSENLGFAKANNQAIEAASGEFILTLNNDTELGDGFLEELMASVDASTERVGMWAPKILSFEERKVIDSVGGLLLYPDGIARGRGRLETDAAQYDSIEDVFIPSACAALYRRAMLAEVGLFDEEFFAYCEDTDLALRARLLGWEGRSVPRARVFHHYSGTGGSYSETKAFLVERNRIWVVVKNFPLPCLALSVFYTLWRYVVNLYGVAAGRGSGGRLVRSTTGFSPFAIVLRAYGSAIRGLPSMYSKRRELKARRVASWRQFSLWLRQNRLGAAELVLKD